jgi:fructose-bisphosphate aldolase class II
MPLVRMLDVLEPALKEGYAVGAFNADSLEMVQAFVNAAETERSPLILQVSQGAIEYAGLRETASVARFMAENATVPIVVHLDHGKDYPQNVHALRAGVSSLGVDASMLPYEENVSVSRQVADLAHHAGLHAEAGIGYVPAYQEGLSELEVEGAKTDPDIAEKFVHETGADFVAVALGSLYLSSCTVPRGFCGRASRKQSNWASQRSTWLLVLTAVSRRFYARRSMRIRKDSISGDSSRLHGRR